MQQCKHIPVLFLSQEVVRNWYARKQDVVSTVKAIVETAETAKKAFDSGDWSLVSECARQCWEQKKLVVGGSGCEPERVTKILKKLYERQVIDAGWLAGAGGGGFLYLITKSSNCKTSIESILMEEPLVGKEMSVHTVRIDDKPFIIDSIEE